MTIQQHYIVMLSGLFVMNVAIIGALAILFHMDATRIADRLDHPAPVTVQIEPSPLIVDAVSATALARKGKK